MNDMTLSAHKVVCVENRPVINSVQMIPHSSITLEKQCKRYAAHGTKKRKKKASYPGKNKTKKNDHCHDEYALSFTHI